MMATEIFGRGNVTLVTIDAGDAGAIGKPIPKRKAEAAAIEEYITRKENSATVVAGNDGP